MRDTIQVARETKNTITALTGNSLRTLNAELPPPPARRTAKSRIPGPPNAIPTQISRRFRSMRAQACGGAPGGSFRRSVPSAGTCSSRSSSVSLGPGSVKGMPPAGETGV